MGMPNMAFIRHDAGQGHQWANERPSDDDGRRRDASLWRAR